MTKRKALIKRLKQAARQRDVKFQVLRQGGNHEVYLVGDLRIPIPRHSEVSERTANDILKECEPALGKDWWK